VSVFIAKCPAARYATRAPRPTRYEKRIATPTVFVALSAAINRGAFPIMNHPVRVLGLAALLASTAHAAPMTQAAREAQFDAGISSADQMTWLKDFSSEPNHVGSPHDKVIADKTLAMFKSWGWDAHIEQYDVLYPTPITTTVEMVSPQHIVLGGQEPAVPGDATSGNTKGALPPYVAFQGDGDVTAPLVYVNYGLPADYEALARRGIDVKGKIAIARYGSGWRGLKPKLAQEHGAIGCIIYSDPADDGYGQSDIYPKGGARPPFSVQRGSVADMTTYPGDPTTPGVGSVPGMTGRLSREQSVTILKIPTLPMSYGDAQQLLAALAGPLAPEPFRGGLPIAYHIGGTPAVTVHLAVKSDWSLKPLYDVVAMLKGAKHPDEWVVRGNHHDGWVFGAADPLSGNVAMLSEAKALGGLVKKGWRPDRTIVYISWDGEEPMLLGSTEYAETHAAELKAKGVVYINTDGNERGFYRAGGSHEYQHLANAVAADVLDPQTGGTIGARVRAKTLADSYDAQGRGDEAAAKAAEGGGDLPIAALGSGSDYSSFLQHLGLPTLDIAFGGEGLSGGVYHSVYDSYDHFTRPQVRRDDVEDRRAAGAADRRCGHPAGALRRLRRHRRALCDRGPQARRRPADEGCAAGEADRRQGIRAGERPARRGRCADRGRADAFPRFRAARQCGGEARRQRQGVRRGVCGEGRLARPGDPRPPQREPARHRPAPA